MQSVRPGRAIIILGVDRSGTSVVANIVHKWGAYSGELDCAHHLDQNNPTGYYENAGISDFIEDKIFSGPSADFATFFDIDTERTLLDKAKDPIISKGARQLVQMMDSQPAPWFWKEPLLSVQLPFWDQFLGEAAYIVTVRNPEESAKSWNKYENSRLMNDLLDTTYTNIIRWQFYLLSILRNIERKKYKLFIPYDDLVRNPERQCGRIAEFLSSFTATKEVSVTQISRMAHVVDKDLWRNRAQSSFDQCVDATAEQKSLFQFISERAAGADISFNESLYPMPPGWRQNMASHFFCHEVLSCLPIAHLCNRLFRKDFDVLLKLQANRVCGQDPN